MKPKLGVWWNRRGASTLEYIVVISAVLILAMALYHTFGGSEVASAIKERVQAAIQGESTGVATDGKETSEKESKPKKENASSQIAQSSPKEEKEESKTVKFLKDVGKVGLDFIGYYDVKAAITGVDEDGNKIGVGERILRGAMVIPIAKPVKGAKMIAKHGDKVIKTGKRKLDDIAKKGKRRACSCPKRVENMGQFFELEFGQKLKKASSRTSVKVQGQTVYRIDKKTDNPYLKKGYGFYLDALHKDHLEVIDKQGKVIAVLNLDGSLNKKKTERVLKEGRRVKEWK